MIIYENREFVNNFNGFLEVINIENISLRQ